jgi:SAM-dependent methyltransferase
MRIIENYSEEIRLIEGHIKAEAADRPVLKVLEAGCGREWFLNTDGIALELTGVDFDEAALDYRMNTLKDLHHGIAGDLRTVELPAEAFDVVCSSFVLEHIAGAEQALDTMVRALKPDGLLIVRVPDLQGVQTLVSRLLPHWAAVAYYRHAWKIEQAGQPGFAPYPTSYDPVISARGFFAYCERKGLELVEEIGVGSYAQRGTGSLSRIVPYVARAISIATLGRVHDRFVDRTFIMRKRLKGRVAAGGAAVPGQRLEHANG